MQRRAPPPLPAHRPDGTLPPLAGDPGDVPRIGNTSPHPTTLETLVVRCATTPERVKLFRGLLAFRRRLGQIGIRVGFQWIGGSLLRADLEPKDVDVVTFHMPPPTWTSAAARDACFAAAPDVFALGKAKAVYGCDARFVDLGDSIRAVRWGAYWSFMLGIDKDSFATNPDAPRRLGFVQVDLDASEAPRIEELLAARGA